MLNFKYTSTKRKSRTIDLIIILGDFAISYFLIDFFSANYAFDTKSSTTSVEFISTLAMALTIALYSLALFINKENFIAEKAINPKFGDWFALGFNALFIMAFLIVILDKIMAVEHYLLIAIFVLGFLFMAAWIVMHWYFMQKVSARKGIKPSTFKKNLGFLLSYPFVILTTIPATLTYQEFLTDPKASLHKENYLTLVLLSVALAFLTWATSYVPRKMQKSFFGVNIKSKFFFWGLLVSYLVKFFFVSFGLIK